MTADTLSEAAPIGLFAMRLDGRLVAVNPMFETLTMQPADELLGQPLRALLTEASQVLYALKVERPLLEVGRADEILLDLRRRDVAALPVLVTIDRDPGDPSRVCGVLFPAPERRAYEQALIAARQSAVAATEARDLLLREVYHRVKNNLQMVDSLLLMQSRRLEDPNAIDALSTMRSRVFALGLVHHQLMESRDLRTFDVAAFLRDLVAHLAAVGGEGVQVRVEAPPMAVGLDFAIPLGLIVTELTTNAMKHVVSDQSCVVEISLTADVDSSVLLRIADNAVRPPGALDDVSLGADIVRGLVGQLRGRLVRPPGPAAVVEILFPAPRSK